jgi:hypothetical protein
MADERTAQTTDKFHYKLLKTLAGSPLSPPIPDLKFITKKLSFPLSQPIFHGQLG